MRTHPTTSATPTIPETKPPGSASPKRSEVSAVVAGPTGTPENAAATPSARPASQTEDTETSRDSYTLSDDDRYAGSTSTNPAEAGPFDVDNGYSRGRAKHGGGHEEENPTRH